MSGFIYQLFYGRSLHHIVVYMVILAVIWYGVTIRIYNKMNKLFCWKLANIVLAIVSVVIIGIVTLSSRPCSNRELLLTPLNSFVEAKIQPEIYRSMLMNVFLFFPLGLTLPYALPQKWKDNAVTAILLALVLSIGIECLQYHFCLGRAETDDVICNTLGTAIGTLSYILAKYKNRMKEYSNSN